MRKPHDEGPAVMTRRDRSAPMLAWYLLVQLVMGQLFLIYGGLRATGRRNVPNRGGAILVSNHLSHLDVFVLGLFLHRPLNYVARSTLFLPVLGTFIRSVGGFPIQREGMGASGLKETLRRLRDGGMVTLFPEGTRSPDGELGELKSGIAVLAARARRADRPGGGRRHVRGVAAHPPLPRSAPGPRPLRPADPARRPGGPLARRRHRPDPRAPARLPAIGAREGWRATSAETAIGPAAPFD